jgi:hypothetical protein
MPEYADIYALASKRTEQAITDFLDHFLPGRIESADEYEIPQYSGSPITVYTHAEDLIRHCCGNPNEVHAIYWRSDQQSEYAMVFFLEDGGLIFGVSTPAEDRHRVDWIADELKRFLDAEGVIVTYEDLPPESTEEFVAFFQSLPSHPDDTARRSRAHRPIKGEQDARGNRR